MRIRYSSFRFKAYHGLTRCENAARPFTFILSPRHRSAVPCYNPTCMGTFSVEIQIRATGVTDKPPVPVKCLVDTGSAFCQFPANFLTSLGISPDRVVPTVLADGTAGESHAGWAEVFYQDRHAFTLVLFGGEMSLALLGAHALEGLGLAADPVRKVLEPARFPLA